MSVSTQLPRLVTSDAVIDIVPVGSVPSFDDVYRDYFAVVWRSARRLGVREAALDDVVQEVFVIVHRRLPTFEGRSSVKTWLFGITLRVVRDHRRAAARRHEAARSDEVDPDMLRASGPGPADVMEQAEAVRVLHALLEVLDEDRREIFVMAELEQLSMPDIASTLGLNVNTAYARLRAARQSFEEGLARYRAREAHVDRRAR